MGTVVARIDMPANDQTQAEEDARQQFLDFVEPKLEALAARPPTRSGNIVHIELLGGNEWSTLNRYLLLVSTDIGEPDIDWAELVPPGGDASVLASGPFKPLHQWPERTET
jgi:hypothetical protein